METALQDERLAEDLVGENTWADLNEGLSEGAAALQGFLALLAAVRPDTQLDARQARALLAPAVDAISQAQALVGQLAARG